MNSEFADTRRPTTSLAFGEGHVPAHMMAAAEPAAPAKPKSGGFLSSVGSFFGKAASSIGNFFGGISSGIKGMFGGKSAAKPAASSGDDFGIEMQPMGASKKAAKPAPQQKFMKGLEQSPALATSGITQDSVSSIAQGFRSDAKERMRTSDSIVQRGAVSVSEEVDKVRATDAQNKKNAEDKYGEKGAAALKFVGNQGLKQLTGVNVAQARGHAVNATQIATESMIRSDDTNATAEQVATNQAVRREDDRSRARDELHEQKSAAGRWKGGLKAVQADRAALKAQATLQGVKIARGTMGDNSVKALTPEQQEMVDDGRAAEPTTFGEKAAHAATVAGDGISTVGMVARGNSDQVHRNIEKSIAEGKSLAPAAAATASGATQVVAGAVAHHMTGGATSAASTIADVITGTQAVGGASDLISSAAGGLTSGGESRYQAKSAYQQMQTGDYQRGKAVEGLFAPGTTPAPASDTPTSTERAGNAAAVALGTTTGKNLEESAIAYGKGLGSKALGHVSNLLH